MKKKRYVKPVVMYEVEHLLRIKAHQLRDEVLGKDTDKSFYWQVGRTGKRHISEMGYNDLIDLILDLRCKQLYGHSLKPIDKIPATKRGKISFRIPFTKIILGVFIKKRFSN